MYAQHHPDAQDHPDWCSRAACTAYVQGGDEYHRSEPLVVKTDDPAVGLYVCKLADPDGGEEFIEFSLLEHTDSKPWHLIEPMNCREILLSKASVGALDLALTAMAW